MCVIYFLQISVLVGEFSELSGQLGGRVCLKFRSIATTTDGPPHLTIDTHVFTLVDLDQPNRRELGSHLSVL